MDSYNELLFWKVIRNSYLFGLILSKNVYHMNWNRRIVWDSVVSVESMLNHGMVGLLRRKVRLGDYIILNNWSKLFQWFKNDKQFFQDLVKNYPQYTNKIFHHLIIKKAIIEDCIGFIKVILEQKQELQQQIGNSSSNKQPSIFKLTSDSIYLAIEYSRFEMVKLLYENQQMDLEEKQLNKKKVWDLIILNNSLNNLNILEYFINIQFINREFISSNSNNRDQFKRYLINLLINQTIKSITLNNLIIILKLLYQFKIINQNSNLNLQHLELFQKQQQDIQLVSVLLNPINFKTQNFRNIVKELVATVRKVEGLNNFLGEKINFSTLDYNEGDLFELFYQNYSGSDSEVLDRQIDLVLVKRFNYGIPLYAPFKFGSYPLFEKILKQDSSTQVSFFNLFEYCKDTNRQVKFLALIIQSLKVNRKAKDIISPIGLLLYLIKYDSLELLQQFSEELLYLVISSNGSIEEKKTQQIVDSLVSEFSICIQSTRVLEFFFNNPQFKRFFIYSCNSNSKDLVTNSIYLLFKNQILNEYYIYLKSLEVNQLIDGSQVIHYNGLVIKPDFDEESNVYEYLKYIVNNNQDQTDENNNNNNNSNNSNNNNSNNNNNNNNNNHFSALGSVYNYRYRFSLGDGTLSDFQISNVLEYSFSEIIKKRLVGFKKLRNLIKRSIDIGDEESILYFVEELLSNIKSETNNSKYYSVLLDLLNTVVSFGSIKTLKIILSVYPDLLKKEEYFQFRDLSKLLVLCVKNDNLILLQYLSNYINITLFLDDELHKGYDRILSNKSLMEENLSYTYINNKLNKLKNKITNLSIIK